MLKQLADGLRQLHEAHILHRDIKPANIFVRTRNPLDICLADFGISCFDAGLSAPPNKAFSLRYASLNQLEGYSRKADDWWSVGIVLHELLCGPHPFDSKSEEEIKKTLINSNIPRLPKRLDAKWQEVVDGLLDIDPNRRWGYEQVQAWCNGSATTPRQKAIDHQPQTQQIAGTPYFDPQGHTKQVVESK